MSSEVLLSGLAGLALIAATGRVALAWLPAGLPGSHRPARWLETWAASHVTGLVVLLPLLILASACDLRWSFVSLGGLAAAAALAHLASGPGNMVPQREPTRLRLLWPATLTLLVVVAIAVVSVLGKSPCHAPWRLEDLSAWSAAAPWQSDPFRLVFPASRVALAVAVLRELGIASVRPWIRRSGTLLCLAIPFLSELALLPTLLLGAGCLFSVAWLRRANARAGILAALCFAAGPTYYRATWPLGLAGLLALVLLTHPNARGSILKACAVALLLAAPAFVTWPIGLIGYWV